MPNFSTHLWVGRYYPLLGVMQTTSLLVVMISDGFSAAQIRRDDADIIGAFRIEHPKVVQSQRRFPMPAVSVLEIAVKGTVVAGIGVDQCPDASIR